MLIDMCVPLPWSIRMKISLGAAKGLAFLHGAEKPVIYHEREACRLGNNNIHSRVRESAECRKEEKRIEADG